MNDPLVFLGGITILASGVAGIVTGSIDPVALVVGGGILALRGYAK